MSESTIRRFLVDKFKALDMQPIECTIKAGVPDLNYCCGWIELKYLAAWPARNDTVVRLRHYTDYQRHWLLRRYRIGGNAYLILKVGRCEWLIYDAPRAQVIGTVSKHETIGEAKLHLQQGFNYDEILRAIHPRPCPGDCR